MAYIGHEPDRGTLKYRRPAKHEGWDCPTSKVCDARKAYGMTVRVPREVAPRHYIATASEKRCWKANQKKRPPTSKAAAWHTTARVSPDGARARQQRRSLSATAHHAFMNQKIMPMSATRSLVTGVGKPARKYQSLPRCVRTPGVSVTLVWWPLAREVFTTVDR